MGRHSKHNTASGHFTYAEYQMLADRWGTQRQRLGSESVRRFDCCSLCLQTARDPVCCSEGHVFCKECILQDLLTQKASIERFKAELERWEREEEAERQMQAQQARERVSRDFEQRYDALATSASRSAAAAARTNGDDDGAERDGQTAGVSNPLKRKAISSGPTGEAAGPTTLSERMAAQAREAERAAIAKIAAEQAQARKAKLPAFWLPSLTPTEAEAPPKVLRDKLKPLCKAENEKGHRITMKTLHPVRFPTLDSETKVCAGCKKVLTTSSILFALKQCGHVHCTTCVSTLLVPSAHPACVECDTPLKLEKPEAPSSASSKADDTPSAAAATTTTTTTTKRIRQGELIQLQREGTGYAAGGISVVEKKGTAFQG
ncbi:uncharacterized protein PFL1_00734 [Pseudozyma flocculosa PF-1]|nr:uncharacterized protein PFL1_00734 [Pseudozyma flocculosa PF-1]EPQ31399.1 hypothetical protein PFL1_00734 [Pseudozyma flocculosa PF-1]